MSDQQPVEGSGATGEVDIPDLLAASWGIFRANLFPFVAGTFCILVLQSVVAYFFLAGLVLAGPLFMGLLLMALNAVRGQEVLLADVFRGFDFFVQAVFLGLAVLIISSIGLPLCFVPGLVLFAMFTPAYFFLIDGEASLMEALSRTKSLIQRNVRSWILIGIYVVCLMALGTALSFVGLVVTVPMSMISLAYAYDHDRRGWPLSSTPLEPGE